MKNYYLSQRVEYTWDDALISCLSSGMRIATIESKLEGKNLIDIARKNSKLFDREIFIDGNNLVENQTPETCISIYKSKRGKANLKSVACSDNRRHFLCEDIIVADNFEEPSENLNDARVDVRDKFFMRIGDYSKLMNDKLIKLFM